MSSFVLAIVNHAFMTCLFQSGPGLLFDLCNIIQCALTDRIQTGESPAFKPTITTRLVTQPWNWSIPLVDDLSKSLEWHVSTATASTLRVIFCQAPVSALLADIQQVIVVRVPTHSKSLTLIHELYGSVHEDWEIIIKLLQIYFQEFDCKLHFLHVRTVGVFQVLHLVSKCSQQKFITLVSMVGPLV